MLGSQHVPITNWPPVVPGSFCSTTPIAATSVTSISVTGGEANNGLVIWLSQTPAATIPTPPSPVGGGPLADWGTTSWTVDLGSSKKDDMLIFDAGATEGVMRLHRRSAGRFTQMDRST